MTKKSKDREEKKLSDTEDLLEDLGRATDKVIEQQKQTKTIFILTTFLFLQSYSGQEKNSKGWIHCFLGMENWLHCSKVS